MTHPMTLAGGVFAAHHDQLMGTPVDFAAFDPGDFAPELVELAQGVWQERVRSEFRSIQILNRFLTEVVGAGDPLDVYAGAVDLVADEIHHTALCAGMCRALGVQPQFPDPVAEVESGEYRTKPMAQRALATAISMLAVNETLSVGFIEDLRARCQEPTVSAVLERTLADEEGHQAWGWSYVAQSLTRFAASTREDWRRLVQRTLEPHRRFADQALASVPVDRRDLDAWPDSQFIVLGLFSRQRQALVFERTYREVLAPRLLELGLV